jgi:hypothetical protein
MLRKNSILIYSLLAILGIVGAWMVGLFSSKSETADISGIEMLMSFLGFVIFCGAIAGFFVVCSRNRNPMTKQQNYLRENI